MLSQLRFWQTRQLPIVLQSETAECGLAAICMIAEYWGHHVDLQSLRKRFSISLKGASLTSLISIAKGLSLESRPVKLEIEELQKLKMPCVLHWDLNHFVVLKSVSERNRSVIIHDPRSGRRRLSIKEVSNHFTGIALELFPAASFQPISAQRKYSVLSMIGSISGLHTALAYVLTLGIALQICALITPFYLQWLVDEALVASDKNLITVLGTGFLMLIALQVSIGALRSWVVTSMSTNLNIQWLNNAFGHLLKLPMSFFEKRHTGDIVSRFSSIRTIQHAVTHQFVEGIIDFLLAAGTLFMLFLYSRTLGAITLLVAAAYVVLRFFVYDRLRNATAEQIVHAAKQETYFLESVRGVQSIRLFGRHEERRIRWLNILADQFNSELRIAKIGLVYGSANELIFGFERILIIWLAALFVLENQFSIGMLFAFVSYKDQFSARAAGLTDKFFEWRMLNLYNERLADIILTEQEDTAPQSEREFDSLAFSIEFRNVSFRFSENDPLILDQLDLFIPAGQYVAITGVSGCGKTTIVKLLLGLLKPTEGEILIGGISTAKLGLARARTQIGAVLQDDTLFAGSLSENISFFDSVEDTLQITASARLAAIDDDIRRMPMGYHTLIGDLGTGLSGGQKQRILLARALYRNPKILVLDEATSHLDVRNEKVVSEAIAKIELTRFVVAHRPETITMADRVVVLSDGRVVQDFPGCRHSSRLD